MEDFLAFLRNGCSLLIPSLPFNQKMDETIEKTKNAWNKNKVIKTEQD